MAAQSQTLVVGFGSTLRGDDALGRIACQRLRTVVDPERVKVIDQTAPTPELAAEVALATRVIFLDASANGPTDEVVTCPLAATGLDYAMAHNLIELARLLPLPGPVWGPYPVRTSDAGVPPRRPARFAWSSPSPATRCTTAC